MVNNNMYHKISLTVLSSHSIIPNLDEAPKLAAATDINDDGDGDDGDSNIACSWSSSEVRTSSREAKRIITRRRDRRLGHWNSVPPLWSDGVEGVVGDGGGGFPDMMLVSVLMLKTIRPLKKSHPT